MNPAQNVRGCSQPVETLDISGTRLVTLHAFSPHVRGTVSRRLDNLSNPALTLLRTPVNTHLHSLGKDTKQLGASSPP